MILLAIPAVVALVVLAVLPARCRRPAGTVGNTLSAVSAIGAVIIAALVWGWVVAVLVGAVALAILGTRMRRASERMDP